MISCFETVTQHIWGQPFCNMSMEAVEMIVKDKKNICFCRPAKSGEVYIYTLEMEGLTPPNGIERGGFVAHWMYCLFSLRRWPGTV